MHLVRFQTRAGLQMVGMQGDANGVINAADIDTVTRLLNLQDEPAPDGTGLHVVSTGTDPLEIRRLGNVVAEAQEPPQAEDPAPTSGVEQIHYPTT